MGILHIKHNTKLSIPCAKDNKIIPYEKIGANQKLKL